MADLTAGWGWPGNARKAHYFARGEYIALCGRWMYTGPRDTSDGPSPDDCAECRRRVVKLTP